MRRALDWLRDRNRIILLLLLLCGSWAYFSVENSNGYTGGVAELDGYYYYVYLRSLQVDGDIDFANEYRDWGNPFEFGQTATGYQRNIFGVGPAILWAPFFLLAHGAAWIGVKLGLPLSLDGMSRFHQTVTFYGTLLYGWLAIVLCFRLLRDRWGKEHALWPALGAALAGPLPGYCLGWGCFSHAQATMAAALLVLLTLRWRDAWTWRRWVGLGAAAGLVVLVRPACAPFLLLPLVEGARAVWHAQRDPAAPGRRLAALGRALGGPLAGAAAALVVFSPQLVVWKILYGRLLLVPQGEDFMLWSQSAWASTLFSPRNGLLPMAPLMAVALLGLLLVARRAPGIGLPLLGVVGATVVVNGAANDWWGWGFSARRFTELLPIFAIGLAEALRGLRERLARDPRRTIAWGTAAVVAAFVIFNLQWMLSFGQRSLDWYSVRSSEGLYMTVTHSLVDRMYSKIGNPLSLPAALSFAARRGGTPRTYDRIDGSFLLGESHSGANPASKPYLHATLDFGELRFRYFLSDSFGTPARDGEARYAPLREPHGHVFLPINRPGDLQLAIGARAVRPGTRVALRFNGRDLGTHPLGVGAWNVLTVTAPARWVARGINRLDLDHLLPPEDPGPRCVGGTGVCSAVDVAAISGGTLAGTFGEVWVAGRRVTRNQRGLNIVLVDPRRGTILGRRGFNIFLHPAEYTELARFLDAFPRGSVVAVAGRAAATDLAGKGARDFAHTGRDAFARFGATGTGFQREDGYAALGALGAPPGSALEASATTEHARLKLGIAPPNWREIAHYRVIRLR